MTIYNLKEIYYTIQGEGRHTGRAAIFCRFTGCNLWNGREKDRESAKCSFCDTDFVGTDGLGGGVYESAKLLVLNIMSKWDSSLRPFVVLTGGEPLLQLDEEAVVALHKVGFEVAIETNGTLTSPAGVNWICVSPKAGATVVQVSGNELKLVYPQKESEAQPELFERFDFDHFFLQPLDDDFREQNIKVTIEYCMKHPRWKLSLQTHKVIGIA